MDGSILPFTDKQRKFITDVNGQEPPEEIHAATWWRYTRRLKIESMHGEAMHTSHQVDADTFYNRDMAKDLRRTVGGVNLREHKRI